MSRIIKFRAWDGKKMMYDVVPWQWDFVIDRTTWKCEESGSSNNHIPARMNVPAYKFTNLMQFTGLHDKNWKEVYEGDIVHFGNGTRGHIIYEAPMYGIAWSLENKVIRSFLNIFWETGEVIGNIYENPELLDK